MTILYPKANEVHCPTLFICPLKILKHSLNIWNRVNNVKSSRIVALYVLNCYDEMYVLEN